jgi:simple sugar transport system permease protein
MTDVIASIAPIGTIAAMAAPLLFATLGALCTEYAGVLAVFMDGAITVSGFVAIAVTQATGSPAIGFAASAVSVTAILFLVAFFTERTKANPFLTGLGLNLFAAGITSWLSSALFGTRGVIALTGPAADAALALPRNAFFPLAVLAAAALAFALAFTRQGTALKVAGSAPEFLAVRGIEPARYRIASWSIAAFFAACAGSVLAFGLGAWVPNMSAGRGWTALAAVYLGFRNPLLAIAAVLVFTGADYASTIMQGTGQVPGMVVLGLPYALALLVFVLIPRKKN